MKIARALVFAAVAASIAFGAGCAMTPVIPPRGIMYTDQSAPLFPATETGEVKGSASAHNILFLVGWGDCSLNTAMKNAGISKAKNVDYELNNYFIFYQRFTVTVCGEKASDAQTQEQGKASATAK